MNKMRPKSIGVAGALIFLLATPGWGADVPASSDGGGVAPRPLVDFSGADAASRFIPSSRQVSVAPTTNPPGIVVTVQPGPAPFPGVTLKPDNGGTWDLTPFGHIEVAITNLGTKPMSFGLRIDASSWQDSDASMTRIKPGETALAKVYFGYNYGQKSNPLATSALTELLVVAPPPKDALETFRVESIQAAGVEGETVPLNPDLIRITPPNGVLLGIGADPIDPAKNLVAQGGATAVLASANGTPVLKLSFPGSRPDAIAGIKPAGGRWGLIDGLEIKAKVRNDGTTPMIPTLRVDSDRGPIQASAATPLAPGAETELVASYINPHIWKNTPPAITADPNTGNKFTSNQVSGVVFSVAPGAGDKSLTIESIMTGIPDYSPPEWLGKRPPVAGDWEQTLDEEFNGTAIDEARWNVHGSNWYDQRTHFTKDNLIVGGGFARLRYEKKTGYPNEDPKQMQTPYAVGYLDSFGKWTQRYGYFEARMKLPTAPGLWPAFWLMPDRGEGSENRGSTSFGGMEFDVMEFLSGWGPFRYNIAMHWDGYKKDHKKAGSNCTYIHPDKNGYVTSGLLWTPGSAVYYCNGQEILHFQSDRISAIESYLIFTMPSGGWDNLPLDDAKLPDDFVIDYVRVWQRKDLASPADGPHTPTLPFPPH